MTFPSRILLATDLSARSDRALDRAVRLARLWKAELVLVHVMEPPADMTDERRDIPSWQRGITPMEQVRRRLRRDLGELANEIFIIIEEGRPADVLPKIARNEKCGLIVTGIARDETLGRRLLGTTVERLVRTSPIPVLVVKRRAARDYRHLLVTTDFSDVSANAIGRTGELFPDAEMVLLHGYDMPFGLSANRDSLRQYIQYVEENEVGAFLNKTGLDAQARDRLHLTIESGDPVRLAASYVTDNDPDLTVIASHGHGALFEMFIGSTAYSLLKAVDSDVLLVRQSAEVD